MDPIFLVMNKAHKQEITEKMLNLRRNKIIGIWQVCLKSLISRYILRFSNSASKNVSESSVCKGLRIRVTGKFAIVKTKRFVKVVVMREHNNA